MQNDKNKNENKMTRAELLAEIERQKAIIAAKERGESAENIEKLINEDTAADTESAGASRNSDSPKEKKNILKKIGRISYITLNVLLCCILFVNAYTLIAKFVFKVDNPTFLGLGYFRVTTWSMEGDEPDSITKGSLVFTVKQKEYEVGDIVTFLSDNDVKNSVTTPTTHRITKILEDGTYKTKGDNPKNSEDKGYIRNDNIIGRVYLTIPGVGNVVDYFKTTKGLIVLTAVCLGFILLPMLFGHYDDDEKEEE